MACASDFDDLINCQICFELFQDPQSLTCRHVLCKKCVDRIKDVTKIECPVCKVQCKVSDIKPDYRTVAMVDSYHKNLTKEAPAIVAKDDLLSKCEVCDDKAVKVSHKCETCDLLFCEKCEALHAASDSDNDKHAVKAISAIAADAKTEIKRTLTDLKAQKEALATKLSNKEHELDNVRDTSDNAIKSITEKAKSLIAKITNHHDNLKKEVEMKKAKHVKKSKQEYKNMKVCYHDVNDKEVLINSWVSNRCDLEIVNTRLQIQKKLKDIDKEWITNQHFGTSAETFTVEVIEGNEYETSGSTKLIFSTSPSVDVNESDENGVSGSGQSEVEEASGSIPSDYTTAEHRDYKTEKTVTIDGVQRDHKQIDNIQRHKGHLYCMAEERIHVYTEDLAHVKTIELDHNGNAFCRALVCVSDKYVITASRSSNNKHNGLRIVHINSNDVQRICPGEFYGLAIHDHKLYAYEYNINKVLIFEQTENNCWKQSGEIYLNYNNSNGYEAKEIISFQMENEQIYIADDSSIYHLDIKGKLKRQISHGKDNKQFRNPKICSVDSKGNLLVAEPEKKILTLVRADGKCGEMMLRGEALRNTHSALIGDHNESLWVAHYEPNKDTSYITKYITNRIQAVTI